MATRVRRPRKRHVQRELFNHGGRRRGAGRKPRQARAGTSHDARPEVNPAQALHVVLRVAAAVGNLRRRDTYHALRKASITAARRTGFRIVHLSIQHNHVHLLVEADTTLALSRGMQGFQISAARNINMALGRDKFRRRRGTVFTDRYHLVVIDSPTQARHVLSYLLNNWRKHREDRRGVAKTWLVDPFSSGGSFDGWRERERGEARLPVVPEHKRLVVQLPQSWLLRTGWQLAGSISACEVPGPR